MNPPAPPPQPPAVQPPPPPGVQPPGRTEGLNQSLATINDRRLRSGLPAFVGVNASCSLVATATGTALDTYQHGNVVLYRASPGFTAGATFAKGPDWDTLSVYQCA